MLPADRFRGLLQRLGASGSVDELLAALDRAWGESHRAYHTGEHLMACLALLDEFREYANEPDEVEIALWFHDAIYDTTATDNEERSAAWAETALRSFGVASARIERIAAMIRATRDHVVPPSVPDAALLIDIDLSILGSSPDEFDRYDRAIRQEYAWVDEDMWRAGRAAVLRRFLDRPAIFSTVALRERFQARARDNTARALAALG